MPKGTKVARCVEDVKAKIARNELPKGSNPYAICQAATKQVYATGKSISQAKKRVTSRRGQATSSVWSPGTKQFLSHEGV